MTANAALAISTPVATSTTATPNAIIPTDPAVSAGPKAAAPTAKSAIAATMPTIHAIASGPAFAKLIAADVKIVIPTPASATAAPKAINPTAPADNAGATFFATINNAPNATTIPSITPAANGPA